MNRYLVCFLAISSLKMTETKDIGETIRTYFDSQIVQDFSAVWQKVRRSYENAVSIALKEAFGTSPQNVLIPQDSPQLASAYYLSDNVIDLLLSNLTLRYHIPRLRPFMPEVNLALNDNLIRVLADLEHIFVEADYYMFRNTSDIEYEGVEDPYKSSPFSLHRIQKQGKLIIVAEQCKLTGIATALLKGFSIHKPGLSSTPVLAPYLSVEQGHLFERLLLKPISNEINPKLQGILFTIINTTSIFGLKVAEIRNYQHELSRKVNDHMRNTVSKMNYVTSTTKGGVRMRDLEIIWDAPVQADFPALSSITLRNMTLNALDSAYAAQLGGVYRAQSIKIADEIRFQELQVRGRMLFENTTHKEVRDFSIELLDVAVSVKLSLDDADIEGRRDSHKRKKRPELRSPLAFALEVVGWRNLEYYVGSGPYNSLHKLAIGHIIDEVPRVMYAYMNHVFGQAVSAKPSSDDDASFGGSSQPEKLKTVEININKLCRRLSLRSNNLKIQTLCGDRGSGTKAALEAAKKSLYDMIMRDKDASTTLSANEHSNEDAKVLTSIIDSENEIFKQTTMKNENPKENSGEVLPDNSDLDHKTPEAKSNKEVENNDNNPKSSEKGGRIINNNNNNNNDYDNRGGSVIVSNNNNVLRKCQSKNCAANLRRIPNENHGNSGRIMYYSTHKNRTSLYALHPDGSIRRVSKPPFN